MSDPQKALLDLIYAHEEAMVHGERGCWACPDRVFEGHSDFAAHVAELVDREFLVMARDRAIRWTVKAPGVTVTCYREVPDGA